MPALQEGIQFAAEGGKYMMIKFDMGKCIGKLIIKKNEINETLTELYNHANFVGVDKLGPSFFKNKQSSKLLGVYQLNNKLFFIICS